MFLQNSLGHPIEPVRTDRAPGGPKSVAGYIAVRCVGWAVPFGTSKAIQVIPPSVPLSASIGRVGRNTGKSLERRDWCRWGLLWGREATDVFIQRGRPRQEPARARRHGPPRLWLTGQSRRTNPAEGATILCSLSNVGHRDTQNMAALLVLPLLHCFTARMRLSVEPFLCHCGSPLHD